MKFFEVRIIKGERCKEEAPFHCLLGLSKVKDLQRVDFYEHYFPGYVEEEVSAEELSNMILDRAASIDMPFCHVVSVKFGEGDNVEIKLNDSAMPYISPTLSNKIFGVETRGTGDTFEVIREALKRTPAFVLKGSKEEGVKEIVVNNISTTTISPEGDIK